MNEQMVEQAAEALAPHVPDGGIDLLLTLGSGLGPVADAVEDATDVAVEEVPGLPTSTVPGHSSTLRFGTLGGLRVLAQVGRIHLYEGHSAQDVTRLVDVAARLGAGTFVVTAAAGGLDPALTPGDLMVLTDHLNLTGTSPLIGVLRDGAPQFVDMAGAYDAELRALAHQAASDVGTELVEGVYAGLLGPAYETPAEVAMLRTLGATSVGMSTVNEVIAARSHGLRVLGLISITNVHGEGVATTHEEVLDVGRDAARRLSEVLLALLPRLSTA